MRIISGTSGGMTLRVPKTVLRPTTDRTRSAVFSILGSRVRDARVADLFAGSGAYGLECLSRGAAQCVFVDSEKAAIQIIDANLLKARFAPRGETACAKMDSWWTRPHRPFDLIFADPPYQKSPDDRAWNRELLGSPQLPKLLAPEGWLILESWSQASEPAVPSPWICQDDRTYGAARVRFFQLQTSAPHE